MTPLQSEEIRERRNHLEKAIKGSGPVSAPKPDDLFATLAAAGGKNFKMVDLPRHISNCF